MADNYCPYCGRYLGMKDFVHACDNTAKMRNEVKFCRRCGGVLNPMYDSMDEAKCQQCRRGAEDLMVGLDEEQPDN